MATNDRSALVQVTTPQEAAGVATGASNERIVRPTQHGNQVSFVWAPGVGMAELICKPGYEDNLRFLYSDKLAGGTIAEKENIGNYKPLRWLSGFVSGLHPFLRLPSGTAEYGTVDKLAEQVRAFIHRYFDCDPTFEGVAVLFVLMTWLYERFHAVPYMRFLGADPETGKSRGTETVGAPCYRPLSFAGAMTPASMYRLIEAAGGTVLIDEGDFSDTQIGADISKLLNCGYQQGSSVVRVEKDEDGNFVPKLYKVFGPKVINGRQRFSDDAVETRCLTYVPQATTRPDIPVQLPGTFQQEATELQNQLLRFRFDYFDSLQPSAEHIEGISRRMNQLILPLLTVCDLLSPQMRNRYRSDLLRFAREADQLKRDLRAESLEATVVRKLVAFIEAGSNPTCQELAQEVLEAEAESRPDLKLSAERVGHMVRGIGLKTKHTKQGSVVLATGRQLRALQERYGIERETVTKPSPEPSPELSRR